MHKMEFFRPSVFGYPARPPPLSSPLPYTPLEVGPLAIPAAMLGALKSSSAND